MRLDKYLKVSRLIKRRTVANEACDAGRVTINDKPAKASSNVKAGDIITISFGNRDVKVEVLDATCPRAGPRSASACRWKKRRTPMPLKDKVLIVEDDTGICNVLTAVLSTSGYETITAATAREADTLIRSHCPDLVLLDLGLPDRDGQIGRAHV